MCWVLSGFMWGWGSGGGGGGGRGGRGDRAPRAAPGIFGGGQTTQPFPTLHNLLPREIRGMSTAHSSAPNLRLRDRKCSSLLLWYLQQLSASS